MIVLFALGTLRHPTRAGQSASVSPAQTAAEIRDALFDGQMALSASPAEAEKALSAAQFAYSGSFAQIHSASRAPGERTDHHRFFRCCSIHLPKADAWLRRCPGPDLDGHLVGQLCDRRTGHPAEGHCHRPILADGARISHDNPFFSTQYQRNPGPRCGFTQGKISPSEALLAVHADLFDTYQAELTEILHDLREVDQRGFAARRVELASLAEGYFWILSPAYDQERGDSALQNALAAFQGLREAALTGQGLSVPLQSVEEALAPFPRRAAHPG